MSCPNCGEETDDENSDDECEVCGIKGCEKCVVLGTCIPCDLGDEDEVNQEKEGRP